MADTTIKLKRDTKDKLDLICKKTETYDDLINRILKEFKQL